MRLCIGFAMMMVVLAACEGLKERSRATLNGVSTEMTITATSAVEVAQKAPVSLAGLVELLRIDLPTFGCWLEKNFEKSSDRFHCGTQHYVNQGDPCERIEEYYETIGFPSELSSRVHPKIKEIVVQFERGEMREMTILFSEPVSVIELRKAMKLSGAVLPSNLVFVEYNESDNGTTNRVTLVGFEYAGISDVEC